VDPLRIASRRLNLTIPANDFDFVIRMRLQIVPGFALRLKIPLALFLIMRNRWPAGVTFVHAAGKATRGEGAAVPLFWRDRGPGGRTLDVGKVLAEAGKSAGFRVKPGMTR
jgi:hypothetical protein